MPDFEELKNRLKLGKVMASYGHAPEGIRGRMKCPFHSSDDTPSFSYDLSIKPHRFKCFGCDARGDVLNFIQLKEPCDPFQAGVIADRILEDPAPLLIPISTQTKTVTKQKESQEVIPTISSDRFISLLENFMYLSPIPNNMADKYLLGKSRFNFEVFKPKEGKTEVSYESPNFQPKTLRKFRIGFLDGQYSRLISSLLKQGFNEEELLSTGIFIRTGSGQIRTAKNFMYRILYPYIRHGKIVGIAGRQTRGATSNKFTKCTTHPEANPVRLINEDVLDSCDYVLITEGVTDCIKACEAGIPSITPATIEIPNDAYELLAPRLNGKDVIICFDTDEAGKKGAITTQAKLKDCGVESRIVDLPSSKKGKKDVCDYINHFGTEAFHQLIFKV